MELLRLIESIRFPAADAFFSAVTLLGDETLFMVIGIIFFWCIDKTEGYYILSVGMIGTVINQFLKLLFRIPRPWVIDKNFTIVESAREAATGYSFPSGHTQISVGTFTSIGIWNKKLFVRIITCILCIIVPFSRLYLGVHTLLDVGVSFVIALVLAFGMYPMVCKAFTKPSRIRILFSVMTVIALAYLFFVNYWKFPADIDKYNYENGLKNAYKMFGCLCALWISFELDTRVIKFETKAPILGQILKIVLGFIPIFLIKSVLKEPLYMIIPNENIADGVRYFMITVFGGCIWPLTFKSFAKISLGKKVL